MTTGKMIHVPTSDGEMPAYLALPEGGSGPGLLFIQEIFGVSGHIMGRCERLARLGYVVLAPALYWRLGDRIAVDESEGIETGMAVCQRLDTATAVADSHSALEHLRQLPEVVGQVGVIGHCFGGLIGFHLAAVADPDAAVLYYPSGGMELAELLSSVSCPVLFEWAGADQFVSHELPDRIRELSQGRDDIEIHVQPGANHAFDNERVPLLHHVQAAATAWSETQDFLRRRLPVPGQADAPATTSIQPR